MLTVINDILDFSKIEPGVFTLEMTPFDLESILQEIILLFAVPVQQKGVELLCENQVALPLTIVGDPEDLARSS